MLITTHSCSCSLCDRQAIIYVIDSSDTSRLPTSRSELLTMLSEDELKNVPVLVFANKQVSCCNRFVSDGVLADADRCVPDTMTGRRRRLVAGRDFGQARSGRRRKGTRMVGTGQLCDQGGRFRGRIGLAGADDAKVGRDDQEDGGREGSVRTVGGWISPDLYQQRHGYTYLDWDQHDHKGLRVAMRMGIPKDGATIIPNDQNTETHTRHYEGKRSMIARGR
jgi:hypothetical protein